MSEIEPPSGDPVFPVAPSNPDAQPEQPSNPDAQPAQPEVSVEPAPVEPVPDPVGPPPVSSEPEPEPVQPEVAPPTAAEIASAFLATRGEQDQLAGSYADIQARISTLMAQLATLNESITSASARDAEHRAQLRAFVSETKPEMAFNTGEKALLVLWNSGQPYVKLVPFTPLGQTLPA